MRRRNIDGSFKGSWLFTTQTIYFEKLHGFRMFKMACSFLNGQRQRVTYGITNSDSTEIIRGVPQGSILDP